MRRMIGLSMLLGLALLGPAGCREKGRPDPEVQMAISHQPETISQTETQGSEAGAGMQGGQGQVAVPTRLEVPDAVKQAYSGVILLWKDSSNGKEGSSRCPSAARRTYRAPA